ncbi:glutathione S-transferase C-terminal domain-containing protein [Bradyrhizobium roseum]|uniref:glutathione S-transferase C-terminal domain-containing protein n=1 Tax=Bradyrhizobium roseum TaxID=3056648 RepID=UPI00387ED133
MEGKRQYDVLDRRLADTLYLAGDDYTIADIAAWCWYGNVALGRFYGTRRNSWRCMNLAPFCRLLPYSRHRSRVAAEAIA